MNMIFHILFKIQELDLETELIFSLILPIKLSTPSLSRIENEEYSLGTGGLLR